MCVWIVATPPLLTSMCDYGGSIGVVVTQMEVVLDINLNSTSFFIEYEKVYNTVYKIIIFSSTFL